MRLIWILIVMMVLSQGLEASWVYINSLGQEAMASLYGVNYLPDTSEGAQMYWNTETRQLFSLEKGYTSRGNLYNYYKYIEVAGNEKPLGGYWTSPAGVFGSDFGVQEGYWVVGKNTYKYISLDGYVIYNTRGSGYNSTLPSDWIVRPAGSFSFGQGHTGYRFVVYQVTSATTTKVDTASPDSFTVNVDVPNDLLPIITIPIPEGFLALSKSKAQGGGEIRAEFGVR